LIRNTDQRDKIIQKAIELGADDAGICLADELLDVSTHRKFPMPEGIKKQHSILVMALNHPASRLDLDYFVKYEGFRFGNSEGNKRLKSISDSIGQWLSKEGLVSRDLHYYVEMGGVFLKEAAVLAGLGFIGKNNLLIHPGYGARIRFRAHLIERPLRPSAPPAFDPCRECDEPCLYVCPARALDNKGYHHDACLAYMDRQAAESPLLLSGCKGQPLREVQSCRICEFACSYRGIQERG
jgi:epoxyqueuosine reductase